jgi:hypothetical protein
MGSNLEVCNIAHLGSLAVSRAIRAGHMAEYPAYFVGDDDHLIGFEEMVCRDDGEAVASAKRLLGDHDIEVWSGDRLVIRLKHTSK